MKICENKVGGDNERGFSKVLPSRLFTETIRWEPIRTRDRRKTDKQRNRQAGRESLHGFTWGGSDAAKREKHRP